MATIRLRSGVFAFAFRPRFQCHGPAMANGSPLRFSALTGQIIAASLDPSDALRPSPAIPRFSHVTRHSTLAERTGSCRLELRRLRSVARVRSVKPTRLIFLPHARGGPADRASHSRRLVILPPGWVMHRRVLFARRSATRIPGQSRGLAGRVVLPSVSSGGAPGVHSLRRFDPADAWSCISA